MSSPKRDKFAALKSKQSAPSASSEDAVAGGSSEPMSSPTSPPVAAATSSSAPLSAAAPPSAVPDAASAPSAAAATATAVATAPAPAVRSGGKFAAMQKATTTKRGDKFSAMASRTTATPDAAAVLAKKKRDEQVQEWTQRSQQRDELWKKLELAEFHVVEFLNLSQQTVDALARQTTVATMDPTPIQELSRQVPRCIQQIHDLLSPAAQFIHAYKAPERINKLYQARVEEGLAAQKKQVLQELIDLESKKEPVASSKAESEDVSGEDETKKRKREE